MALIGYACKLAPSAAALRCDHPGGLSQSSFFLSAQKSQKSQNSRPSAVCQLSVLPSSIRDPGFLENGIQRRKKVAHRHRNSLVVANVEAPRSSSAERSEPSTEFPELRTYEAAVTTVLNPASRKGPNMPIPPPAHPTYKLLDVIRYALAEDAGDRGDITCFSTIPAVTKAQAQFLAKADGIIAGIDLAEMIFREVDPELKVEWQVQDGDPVWNGLRFGSVNGNARSILIAERVVLNFMQRMSGIATSTTKMAEAARPARILDTRKTAPGLRLIDKWAVLIGSGENHRMGLYDMMMVKDNHVDVSGGIKNAIAAADKYIRENKLDVGVEMETRTLKEVEEVLECILDGSGKVVTRIMLDNMVKRLPEGGIDVSMLQQAVHLVNGVIETEASGNVTLQTVKEIGATGVTYISSGALTHSVEALDISLKVKMQV